MKLLQFVLCTCLLLKYFSCSLSLQDQVRGLEDKYGQGEFKKEYLSQFQTDDLKLIPPPIVPYYKVEWILCPGAVHIDESSVACTSTKNGWCDLKNGRCICQRGYTGSACNECSKEFVNLATKEVVNCREETTCPNNCTSQGVCDRVTGTCACNEGFGGTDCRLPACNSNDCSFCNLKKEPSLKKMVNGTVCVQSLVHDIVDGCELICHEKTFQEKPNLGFSEKTIDVEEGIYKDVRFCIEGRSLARVEVTLKTFDSTLEDVHFPPQCTNHLKNFVLTLKKNGISCFEIMLKIALDEQVEQSEQFELHLFKDDLLIDTAHGVIIDKSRNFPLHHDFSQDITPVLPLKMSGTLRFIRSNSENFNGLQFDDRFMMLQVEGKYFPCFSVNKTTTSCNVLYEGNDAYIKPMLIADDRLALGTKYHSKQSIKTKKIIRLFLNHEEILLSLAVFSKTTELYAILFSANCSLAFWVNDIFEEFVYVEPAIDSDKSKEMSMKIVMLKIKQGINVVSLVKITDDLQTCNIAVQRNEALPIAGVMIRQNGQAVSKTQPIPVSIIDQSREEPHGVTVFIRLPLDLLTRTDYVLSFMLLDKLDYHISCNSEILMLLTLIVMSKDSSSVDNNFDLKCWGKQVNLSIYILDPCQCSFQIINRRLNKHIYTFQRQVTDYVLS